ncbi:MAG: hypothetical protein IKY23_12460 [Lachnospiraceae bacterium]|nr:hypothetical protein [Lachnospiraceae bacterium]
MNQKKHIDEIIRRADLQKVRSERIQMLYEKYVNYGLETDFEMLLTELDSYCIPWVRKQLWKTGCFSDENENTALQESRLAAWQIIEKDRKSATCRGDFAYYVFGVYKHKVMNEIRKFSSHRNKVDIHSFFEVIGDNNQALGEKIPAKPVDYDRCMEEQRALYERIFITYCRVFMESATFPPRILALYYARVLPHLKEEIPDTKATSAKWAYEYMGKSTIDELRFDSENYLCHYVDNSLHWCDAFILQLSEEVTEGGITDILKNLVYTEVYSKGKIEDWADYMHKASIKGAMEKIVRDCELLEMGKEYINKSDTLYKFLRKEK